MFIDTNLSYLWHLKEFNLLFFSRAINNNTGKTIFANSNDIADNPKHQNIVTIKNTEYNLLHIIAACKMQDQQAQMALFRYYHEKFYGICLRYLNKEK